MKDFRNEVQALGHLGFRRAAFGQRKDDVFPPGHVRKQGQVLEHHRYVAFRYRQLRRITVVQKHNAVIRPEQPEDQLEYGGLAGRGRSENAEELARFHVQVDRTEGEFRIGLDRASEFNRIHQCRPPRRPSRIEVEGEALAGRQVERHLVSQAHPILIVEGQEHRLLHLEIGQPLRARCAPAPRQRRAFPHRQRRADRQNRCPAAEFRRIRCARRRRCRNRTGSRPARGISAPPCSISLRMPASSRSSPSNRFIRGLPTKLATKRLCGSL